MPMPCLGQDRPRTTTANDGNLEGAHRASHCSPCSVSIYLGTLNSSPYRMTIDGFGCLGSSTAEASSRAQRATSAAPLRSATEASCPTASIMARMAIPKGVLAVLGKGFPETSLERNDTRSTPNLSSARLGRPPAAPLSGRSASCVSCLPSGAQAASVCG